MSNYNVFEEWERCPICNDYSREGSYCKNCEEEATEYLKAFASSFNCEPKVVYDLLEQLVDELEMEEYRNKISQRRKSPSKSIDMVDLTRKVLGV